MAVIRMSLLSCYFYLILATGNGQEITCSSCLMQEPSNAWCLKQDFGSARCGHQAKLVLKGCPIEYMHFGSESKIDILLDKPFTNVENESAEDLVQLRPQHVKIKLRPNDVQTFNISFRVVKNYPLDMYYLMDLTATMEPHRIRLVNIGKELPNILQQITKYGRLGFGSYSDKPVEPFSFTKNRTLFESCKKFGIECTSAYDFHHKQHLTSETVQFTSKVNDSKLTADRDHIEGGLDALAQIILCKKTIGWRKRSRKIVFMVTEGLLHFAGDGLLLGAVKKTSEKCRLNSDGFYTGDRTNDYPSFEEISRLLEKHKINLVFAVSEDVMPFYAELNALVPDFTFLAKITGTIKDFQTIIETGFTQVTSKLTLYDDAKNPLQLSYESICPGMQPNASRSCYSVTEGYTYNFKVKVSFDECPENRSEWIQEFAVKEINTGEEEVRVTVEMACGCECKKTKVDCVHGTENCGICVCDEGWSGKDCSCKFEDMLSPEYFDGCRQKTGSNISLPCHMKGQCLCGECLCFPGYEGPYCECSTACPTNTKGEVCSGPKSGHCDCGDCICHEGYQGEDCSCVTSNSSCIFKDQICSGNGDCVCGVCKCQLDVAGKYCHILSEEIQHLECSNLKPTVMNISENDVILDGFVYVDSQDEINEDDIPCGIYNFQVKNSWCLAQFFMGVSESKEVVKIQRMGCAQKASLAVTASSIIAIILLCGCLILGIWKVHTHVKDKKEYIQFQRNLSKEVTQINPLYVSPIKEYRIK